jgi:hypothetical protein
MQAMLDMCPILGTTLLYEIQLGFAIHADIYAPQHRSGPQEIKLTTHDRRYTRPSPGHMILHTIILESIGAYLITTLSRTHLLPPIQGLCLIVLILHSALHSLPQHFAGFIEAILPATALCLGCDARGFMSYATAILMFVAMLSTTTGSAIPFDLEILLA